MKFEWSDTYDVIGRYVKSVSLAFPAHVDYICFCLLLLLLLNLFASSKHRVVCSVLSVCLLFVCLFVCLFVLGLLFLFCVVFYVV